MKYIYAMLCCMMAAAACAQQKTKVIFFADPKLPPGVGGYDIYVDDALAGHMEAGAVINYSLAPGNHTVRAKTEQETSIPISVEAGTTQYFESGIQIGSTGGGPKFRPVPAGEGKSAINNIDPATLRMTNKSAAITELPKQPMLIFYSDPKLPSGTGGYDVYADDALVGRLTPRAVLTLSVNPGTHTVRAKTEQESVQTVSIEPGGTRYFECGVQIGATGGSPTFKEVPEADVPASVRNKDPRVAAARDAASQTEFGLKAGANFSTLSSSINSTSSSVTGFHFGMYMRARIERDFYFRPELYYSSQGQDDAYKYTNGASAGSATTTLNYVNLPLLFEGGRVVTFQFGPQVGFPVSGKQVGTVGNTKLNDDLKSIMKTELSLVLGLGLNVSQHVHLGVRYHLGMTDAMKISGATSDFKIQNRVIHAFVGVSF
jgi:hypothetical protein